MVTLEMVKKALNIEDNYQDDALQQYFDEVIDFLKDAGVSEVNITAGIVTQGVGDLWNYGAGTSKLSPYFIQRATQLAYRR